MQPSSFPGSDRVQVSAPSTTKEHPPEPSAPNHHTLKHKPKEPPARTSVPTHLIRPAQRSWHVHVHCALRILSQRMRVYTVVISPQAEVTSFTFAEACAQPSAKRVEFHGSDGPVNVVEVEGTFFIENHEAEAKAARSKALELASEVVVGPKAAANPAAAAAEVAANPAAAEDEVAANPAPMPEPAAAHRISYAAAAAKSAVGPKPSAAGFEPRAVAPPKFSAGLKRSTPAAQPAVVPAPLEVSICMIIGMHVNLCRCTARLLTRVSRPLNTTPKQVVDDFARAQSTPLPECITGVEGDKVRAPRPPQPSSLIP